MTAPISFRSIYAIGKRELRSFFISPVAYIIITGFIFISSYFFTAYVSSTNQADLSGTVNNIAIVLFLILPFLTMKLLSEEKKSGTFELLQTSPVTPLDIVLGKYFSALLLYGLMLFFTAGFPIYLEIKADPYWPVIAVQYLGLFLTGSAIIGIGLAASAFTENQIVSGIIGFSISFGLLLISWLGTQTTGLVKAVIDELTIINHLDPFVNGVIAVKDIIYFLLWIVFSVFLSSKAVESQSWRS
ncbi:MAG: hypothetical protein A2096_05855 [Spirochaetes bacterium GWF1_41_5]|nr:MAG: hypothetical protein A2096_05855 [Spirochaetes bacterium GWF1_41_5]HBE01696.1 ABC transporter permease [Spirochaetia bacterium]